MNLYDNNLYLEDVRTVAGLDLPWDKLSDKTVVLSGATGLIGSFLVDTIIDKNETDGLNCSIIALGRSKERFKERFSKHISNPGLVFEEYDIQKPLNCTNIEKADYVLHLASNTHPLLYSTDPIGTILTNILGVKNMLDFSVEHNSLRFAFASSNEMYGENRGDVEMFDEKYCGYIDCNTLRAGYPESKRCGEALCQAYMSQKDLDIVVPRITRTYGPTMKMEDTKAISQFIKKGIAGEDIILKSAGTQYYSYTYVSDAVSGLLTVLLKGRKGEAYNIADEKSDIMLKDLAAIIANTSGCKVVYEKPDDIEAAGYSTATKARLNSCKLQALGWVAKYDIRSGIERTLSILNANS